MQVKSKRIRSVISVLLVPVVIGILFSGKVCVQAAQTAYQNGPDIYGEAYCVMDADTGDIICGKDAMGMYHPASITKIMTALVVLEQVEDLEEELTFSDSAVNGISSNSSTLNPKAMVGEKMSVWDCLNGMMLASGNECAAALAEYTAGSMDAFAELMNRKAEEIGTTNTHFTNAHGLDNAEHYTNPYDMALIFRAALQNDLFSELDSTVKYTIPATNLCGARELTMGHQMVCGAIPYDGVFAGKTGRTALAGRTLVTAAKHNGHTVIVVVMKSGEEYIYTDTEILLDYTYALLDGQQAWNWSECREKMVATGNVNLREKASEHATIRGSLLEGQEVLCTGRYADWSRVEIDGLTYYVNSAWLQYPDGTPSPTTSTTSAQTEPEETEPETSAAQTEPEASEAPENNTGGTDPQEQVKTTKSEIRNGILIAICLNTGVVLLILAGYIWYRRIHRRGRRKR